MRQPVQLGSAAIGAAAAALGVAAAQESYFVRDRNVSVADRVQAYNRADGVRVGQLVLRPQLDLGLGWTSNAFALSDSGVPTLERFEDEAAGFGFVRASVAAATDWNRHEVRFAAYAEATGNERFDSEAYLQAGASLGGLLEAGRSATLFGEVSFDSSREGRGVNSAVLLAAEPIAVDLIRAELGARRESGRTRLEARLDLARYDYDDVQVVPLAAPGGGLLPQGPGDQDFRDHDAYRARLEAAYAVTRDMAVGVHAEADRRDYDAADAAGVRRDSEGFEVGVGVELDLTDLVRGTVEVGYFERDFEDEALADTAGVAVDALAEWFVTPLTTLTLSASRDAAESPFLGAAAVIRAEVLLRADHELRRDTHLFAYGGLGRDEYRGLDRTFRTATAGAGARYYISDHLWAAAEYVFSAADRSEGGRPGAIPGVFGAPYDEHRALVTLTVTP